MAYYCFNTRGAAVEWAEGYGYNCKYRILRTGTGLYYVVWDHNEPKGV